MESTRATIAHGRLQNSSKSTYTMKIISTTKTVPLLSEPTGMKLHTLTQASVYKLLRSLDFPPESRRSKILLDRTQSALEALNNSPSRDENIWQNVRHPDIRWPIQTFLLRALHASLKIGEFWENIPLYEQRARCSICNEATESLEHILLDCHRGQANCIWTLTNSIWPTAFGAWPEIHLITILGCGSVPPCLARSWHPQYSACLTHRKVPNLSEQPSGLST